MLPVLDRYTIRAIIPPFVMALLVFTFMLTLPFILELAEPLISKGAPASTVLRLMLTLVPQALAVTIPMALLVGILVGLGRLSSDREWVALQACGVGIGRIVRPVLLLGVAATAATLYVYIWAVPDANQTAREIRYNVVAQLVEGEVKPRVFFDHFPNRVLLVRDVPPGGGIWRDVFLADSTDPHNPVVYLADRGHMVLDRGRRSVELVLEDGTQHTGKAGVPQDYSVARFRELVLSLDPETVFPRSGPAKGDREMSIAELNALIVSLRQQGISTHNPVMEIQKKFSIPAACLVFALLGVVYGLTNRRDAKFASFVKGILVIYVYYFFLMNAQSAAKGAWVPAWLATWVPNILLGGLGVWLLLRYGRRDGAWLAWLGRARTRLEGLWPRLEAWRGAAGRGRGALRRAADAGSRWSREWQLRFNVLDGYIGKMYLRVFLLTFVALVGIFQISTFIDLSDKLFKGTTTADMLLRYMWYRTPQFIYWCIPLSVLIGGLVTVGILTRTSELVVMRACGISLYRAAAPLLVFAVAAGGVLFLFEERVLAHSNLQAGGGTAPRDPRRVAADDRHPRPAVDSGPAGRGVQLRVLRPEAVGADRVFGVPVRAPRGPAAEPRVLPDGELRGPGHGLRADGAMAGPGRLGARVRSAGGAAGVPARRSGGSACRTAAVLHERTDGGRAHDLRPVEALHRRVARERRERHRARGGTAPEGVVSLGDADHDADCRALRRHHRAARRDVRNRPRHRAGPGLLGGDERVRSDWRERRGPAAAGRVGAEHPVRRRRRVPPAHRQDVTGRTSPISARCGGPPPTPLPRRPAACSPNRRRTAASVCARDRTAGARRCRPRACRRAGW
jgi:LPS export ABC transporter permease LptF